MIFYLTILIITTILWCLKGILKKEMNAYDLYKENYYSKSSLDEITDTIREYAERWRNHKDSLYNDIVYYGTFICTMILIPITIVLLVVNCFSFQTAYRVKMYREQLITTCNKSIYNYTFTDVTYTDKAEMIKNVYDFNVECKEKHYWHNNIVFNWFFPEDVVNEYKPITKEEVDFLEE